MEAAATEVAVEVAAMVVVDVEVAAMAETVDMVVDVEAVAAMVVDRAAMTRVATKTSPPKLCTVQMLNIKYSPCVLSLLSNNLEGCHQVRLAVGRSEEGLPGCCRKQPMDRRLQALQEGRVRDGVWIPLQDQVDRSW